MPMGSLTITLPDSLIQAIKEIAEEEHTSVSRVIEAALRSDPRILSRLERIIAEHEKREERTSSSKT